MPEQRTCVCGKRYWWPGAQWQHEGCARNAEMRNQLDAANTNGASNNASNRSSEDPGSELAVGADGGGQKVADLRSGQVGDDGAERCGGKAKQRWSREAYNAYQREYMRKYRESH